jgi:hypothetical protein
MKIAAIYQLVCLAYANILRDLLKKAIEDPENDWDDAVLHVLDNLFDYSQEV